MHLPIFFPCFAIVSLILAVCYVWLISRYLHGWALLKNWNIPADYQPFTKVTVLVPARNEAKNITACLAALERQTYPRHLQEIIVIDDHSSDETFQLAGNFSKKNPRTRAIKLADFMLPDGTQSFKKKAIETGISLATGDLIVTTDADCLVPQDWLMLLVSFFEKNNLKFVAAPVVFHEEKKLLERFQSLDFMGMMLVTGAGIQLKINHLCNGANLAYLKSTFYEVGGFEGIDKMASGDDMLLLHKIAAGYPGQVGFLKNKAATVQTKACPDLRSFLSQRTRWASKSSSYQEKKITVILGMVFLFCVSIFFSFLTIPLFGWKMAWLFLALFVTKTVADYLFLKKAAQFFGRADLMKGYLLAQILHILYIVSVGILGNFKKRYEWKGRKVR